MTGAEASPEDAAAGPSFGEAAAEMANETEIEEASLSLSDQLAVTQMELEERTRDLQRLQAEYLKYGPNEGANPCRARCGPCAARCRGV